MPIDKNATRTLSYGLFVLTAQDGGKDNGCIVNTVQQVTGSPLRISVAVNKENLTHDMIAKTGLFNVSVLDVTAPMSLFEHFGFQSGRTADKFSDWPAAARSENGLMYLTEHANAFFSGKVVTALDCGTHTLFLADVTEAGTLSQAESVTYQYYFAHIKPKPAAKKKGFICKICGYIYEGDELPADFICPLCKHGVEAFEPLEPDDKKEEKAAKKYVCDVCGWTYDEAAGDPEHGIAPGTKWEDLPAGFECPVCGVGKDSFSAG